MDDQLFYYLAAVPVLGVIAQVISFWTRLPSILLLLLFGILLGMVASPDQLLNDLTGSGDSAAASKILFPIVSLSVGIILFEGGLSLRLNDLRGAGAAVFRLVTLGAGLSWVLTTVLAMYVLKLDWRVSLLLGAVLVVTGPTVVAPLIRHIRPNRKISSIIKWEGIVIDPIGAVLAVLVFEHIIHVASERPVLSAFLTMLWTALVGVVVAALTAVLLVIFVKRYWIPDFLHGVMFLAASIGAFALSNQLFHESGLVTVTVLGIVLANQKYISIDHVVQFKENLGVLLISSLFIVLGSRLDMGQLTNYGPRICVCRVADFDRAADICLAFAGWDRYHELRTFVSFVPGAAGDCGRCRHQCFLVTDRKPGIARGRRSSSRCRCGTVGSHYFPGHPGDGCVLWTVGRTIGSTTQVGRCQPARDFVCWSRRVGS
ncbi:MAG: cation:proton antiporter [Pirellulaceae bacterium]